MDSFGYDIEFFENIPPFEREIYIGMLMHRLEKDRERLERQKHG